MFGCVFKALCRLLLLVIPSLADLHVSNKQVLAIITTNNDRILDSLVVECWFRVREVSGSTPSQGPRHAKDVIKMVPVAPLFSTERSKGKILALSQELK